MTTAQPRPPGVTIAFGCWLAAASILVFLGILGLVAQAPVFIRGVGVILAIAGLVIGYLATRMRKGDKRFQRAAVALAMVLSVLLIVLVMLFGGLMWLLPMVLLWGGAFAVTRAEPNAWFDELEPGSGHV